MNKLFLCLSAAIFIGAAYAGAMEQDKTELNKKLAWAIGSGHDETVASSLRQGADPNYIDCGTPVLVDAIKYSSPQVISLLLQYGANPEARNGSTSALRLAIRTNDPAVVRAFLSNLSEETAKKILSEQDSLGTALHELANQGEKPNALEIAKILIEAGALASKKDVYDETPAAIATMHGCTELAVYLLEQETKEKGWNLGGILSGLRNYISGN